MLNRIVLATAVRTILGFGAFALGAVLLFAWLAPHLPPDLRPAAQAVWWLAIGAGWLGLAVRAAVFWRPAQARAVGVLLALLALPALCGGYWLVLQLLRAG